MSKLNKGQYEEMQQMLDDGVSVEEIAEKFDVSTSWVYQKTTKQQSEKQSQAVQVVKTDNTPLGNKNNLRMQDTFLQENQVLHMLQETPREYTYTRAGRGGQEFTYVTGNYVKRVLNYVFGWNWDFEIVSEKVFGMDSENGHIVVQGKLTVKSPDDQLRIVKTQYGRADVKYLKKSGNPVDIGNDFKAAATDALKKCASELGIASDIYSGGEFGGVEVDGVDPGQNPMTVKETTPEEIEVMIIRAIRNSDNVGEVIAFDERAEEHPRLSEEQKNRINKEASKKANELE